MGWREYAEQVKRGGDNRDSWDKSPPIVSVVPIVPPLDAATLLPDWSRGLGAVDPLAPRSGWSASRWARIYDAGLWWLDAFGQQAARDGWSTGDVFGVRPSRERWGGLLDRVGDNRTLLMTEDRASWRSYGVAQSYKRTAGAGLRPFWESDL